jgi:hypothetical protein
VHRWQERSRISSDVGNPYFAAENTYYGIHVSILYANTGGIKGGSGENTPRMAVSLPFFLHKHPQPIERPQTCYRGVKIAPRTVMALEGLAKIEVLFATSPQLGKNFWVLKFNPSASYSIRKAWAKVWVKATLWRGAVGKRGHLCMLTRA